MKTTTLLGFVLIVLGVLALAYQGINYTTHKKVLDVGPIQATKDGTQHDSAASDCGWSRADRRDRTGRSRQERSLRN